LIEYHKICYHKKSFETPSNPNPRHLLYLKGNEISILPRAST